MLQPLTGAYLKLQNLGGIVTADQAARATGCKRSAVGHALQVWRSDDPALMKAVVDGRISLSQASKQARGRVNLLKSYEQASPTDKVALGVAATPEKIFDDVIVQALKSPVPVAPKPVEISANTGKPNGAGLHHGNGATSPNVPL